MEAEVISASDKSYSIGIFDLALWLAHRTHSLAFVTTNLPPINALPWGGPAAPVSPNGTCGTDPRFTDLLRHMNLQP